MKLSIMLCIVSIFFYSCGNSSYLVKYQGDEVEIVTIAGTHIIGELVALSDESVILLRKEKKDNLGRIIAVKISGIRSIEVNGYSSTGWKASVILTQLTPAVVLGLTAAATSEVGQGIGIALVLSIPAVLTYMLYDAAATDPPRWEGTEKSSELEQLRKYARMPEGITDLQLKQLLNLHKQTAIIEIDGREK